MNAHDTYTKLITDREALVAEGKRITEAEKAFVGARLHRLARVGASVYSKCFGNARLGRIEKKFAHRELDFILPSTASSPQFYWTAMDLNPGHIVLTNGDKERRIISKEVIHLSDRQLASHIRKHVRSIKDHDRATAGARAAEAAAEERKKKERELATAEKLVAKLTKELSVS